MNPEVDAYIQASKRWPAEITALLPVLLDTPLTEELKWRSPCYSHETADRLPAPPNPATAAGDLAASRVEGVAWLR